MADETSPYMIKVTKEIARKHDILFSSVNLL